MNIGEKKTHKILRREKRIDIKTKITELEENKKSRKNPKKFFECFQRK